MIVTFDLCIRYCACVRTNRQTDKDNYIDNNYDIVKSGPRPHAKLAAWISEPRCICG